MRLVFGVRSMNFKKFQTEQIKLDFLSQNKDTLEVRQNYFHLYFIPVFPLSKQYFIVSKDGLKRELSELELQKIRETSISYRFPLLSFSLPILIILGFLAYSVYTNIDYFLANRKQEKNASEYYSSLHVSLKNAQKNDVLIFYRSRVPASKAKSEEEQRLFDYDLMKMGAWVKERKGNKYTLCFIENGTMDFISLNQIDLDKIPDMPNLDECTMELNLDELDATIPKLASHFFQPSEAVVKLGNRDGYYSLDKIESIRLPLPQIMMSQGLASNGKYILLNLANMGVDAQIQEIKTIYGDLNWIEKFPLNFPTCSRGNGCSIQLGANFQRNKFPIQISKMKITYANNRWITYLIVVTDEELNLIYLYKN